MSENVLEQYHRALRAPEGPTSDLRRRAREEHIAMGGCRASFSLHAYDHRRFGPFLGVSDEGSAAQVIRKAAYASPKARALGTDASALSVGVAVDAERLVGIGEVVVGPEEYADIWLETVGRALITTNVGTRVNLRVHKREPRIELRPGSPSAELAAHEAVAKVLTAFETAPEPRAGAVHVELTGRATAPQRRATLRRLVSLVAERAQSSQLSHRLALVARIGWGPPGQAAALRALELAASAGIKELVLDGVTRKQADEAISYAGLLNYLAPGLLGPILRKASALGIALRAANLPDTETIARSVWSTLLTARNMGAHLGKYGCFPLTLEETTAVVGHVQRWFDDWSAAPVFFVDQGLLTGARVDSGKDVMRGLGDWLEAVASAGARIVLIDTVDKGKAKKLLRTPRTPDGTFSLRQVAKIEQQAAGLGLRLLWAGGLSEQDAFELASLGVFGIYVTTAVSAPAPVRGAYTTDPTLAAVKEPAHAAVLRTKTLIEAGFLIGALGGAVARSLEGWARATLAREPGAEELLYLDTLAAWRVWFEQQR